MQEQVAERALLWIVLLPMLGALINGTVGQRASREVVQRVAVGSVAVAFGLAIYAFIALVGAGGQPLALDVYEWFSIRVGDGEAPIMVRFLLDRLSGVMTLVVTGIGLLIHIYSCGYMSEEKAYARFFCYLNLFTASMLILVLASNLPLMFVGWEGVGLCSYLLIGFWYENSDYAAAGRKAFVANRIGDFGVLIGMFLLVAATGSFEFAEINGSPAALTAPVTYGDSTWPLTVATAAALFLFLGCTGKSAQIPLYVWLPDAMAGPTPVSALIHAATMVTAGVYLICRLSPMFSLAPAAMAVIAIVGALTALLAASIALVQDEIKKVLAYSTVSQLGFMVAAAGVGAFAAGFFHVFTHAFFKACLFLGAGSVMHAVGAHGDADIRKLGGLRKYMPTTRWTFLASCMAIAGVPLTSGFFSKDEILLGTLTTGHYFDFAPWLGPVVFVTLVVAASMTAFYMFRLYFLTFSGEYRGAGQSHGQEIDHDEAHGHGAAHGHGDAHGHGEPHESPGTMTAPLIILGIGALVVGFLGLPHALHLPNVWGDWLAPVLGSIHGTVHHGGGVAWIAMAAGTAAFLVGWGLAYTWYVKQAGAPAQALADKLPGLRKLLQDKWRIDPLYNRTVIAANKEVAMLSAQLDKEVVDGFFAKLSALGVKGAGFAATRLQNGQVHAYAAVMVLGMAVMAWWFILPHPRVEAAESNGEVRFAVAEGLGYEYRYDFDGDGVYDTPWSREATASHRYTAAEVGERLVVKVHGARGGEPREVELEPGELLTLRSAELGRWQRGMENDTRPYAEATPEGLRVRPNGALVTAAGRPATSGEVQVAPGESALVGEARLSVHATAESIVAVRNAFGYEAKERVPLALTGVERGRSPEEGMPAAHTRSALHQRGTLQ